jgi:hypothetical protein
VNKQRSGYIGSEEERTSKEEAEEVAKVVAQIGICKNQPECRKISSKIHLPVSV